MRDGEFGDEKRRGKCKLLRRANLETKYIMDQPNPLVHDFPFCSSSSILFAVTPFTKQTRSLIDNPSFFHSLSLIDTPLFICFLFFYTTIP